MPSYNIYCMLILLSIPIELHCLTYVDLWAEKNGKVCEVVTLTNCGRLIAFIFYFMTPFLGPDVPVVMVVIVCVCGGGVVSEMHSINVRMQ